MNKYEEIDLVDLLFYYLKKWRWIITAMLVLAVVMGISQYQRTITENKSKQKVISEEKTKEEEDTSETQKDVEAFVLEDPNLSAVKASVSGMALGLFLTMLFIMPGYILGGRLQNIEKFNDCFGIPLLGIIFAFEKQSRGFVFLDRWILRLEKGPYVEVPYGEQVRICASNIQNIIRKEEKLGKIMLAGTISEKEAEKICPDLVFEIEGAEFSQYKQMVFQASTLEELENYDGILFIEKRGKSCLKYIKWEKDLAMDRGVKILGAVIF